MSDVDSAASDLASAFSAALSGIVSDEVASTASSPAGIDRTKLGLDLFGDGEGLLAAQMHLEYATEYAPEAADELRDIITGELIEVDLARLIGDAYDTQWTRSGKSDERGD